MAAVGGSIREISIAGQNYSVASDTDVRLKLGGTKSTVHKNGDGSTRVTGEQEPWSLSDIDVSIDASSDQLVVLQRTANAMEFVPCTIKLIDSTVYQGNGLLVDDRDFSTAKAIMRLTLMGTGELTRQ